MVIKIIVFIIAAVLFYAALCTSLNTYFKNEFKFPKKILFSDKKTAMLSAVAAVLSCVCLYFCDATAFGRIFLFYVFCIFLAAAAVTDIKKNIIPNKLILILAGIWLIYIIAYIIVDRSNGIASLISSLAGFIFSLLVFGVGYVFMKNKLGGGDVKLTLVMGLILTGDAIFGALIYGLGLSLVFAIAAMITKKMKMTDCMPFAPFLFLGTVAAIAVI